MLTAYYLNGCIHSIVPRHISEDFNWMADIGTDSVAISMYERDIAEASRWELFLREAEKAGLKVFAVPSRWGGLVAGWPGVPSIFTATHPETWMLDKEGNPYYGYPWGPVSSVHHEKTQEFFKSCIDKILQYPVEGIIWDEPKTLWLEDYSPAARAKMPKGAGLEWNIDSTAEFFGEMSRYAKSIKPGLVISLFIYARLEGYVVERCAQIQHMDHFGCDGAPWTLEDNRFIHGGDASNKVLLPNFERFRRAAQKNGKGSFMLLETQGQPLKSHCILDKRLPEILSYKPEHLAYYYFGRGAERVEELMEIQARHLKKLIGSST